MDTFLCTTTFELQQLFLIFFKEVKNQLRNSQEYVRNFANEGRVVFTNLPTEMVIDILSRLPIRSIITCKFVCKSWRNLVDSLEFAKSHLGKAVPHLVVFLEEMFEFADEHRSAHLCKIVSNLSFPHPGVILGSVNGILFWCYGSLQSRDLFVCNPITREYLKLPPPPKFESLSVTAGVGVSKMSGNYKIVRILQVYNKHYSQLVQCECQLHTLGTGSWRSFSVGTQLEYITKSVGAFLNGNLHWLAYDSRRVVSCFDLETELFTSFSSPPGLQDLWDKTLSVVGDRLCFCDNSPYATFIWFMSKYGDEKSWTKEFIISHDPNGVLYGSLFPIKVFINGDILIAREYNSKILCYSKTTDAIYDTGIHKRGPLLAKSAVIYTPTFLPLRTLLMLTENVSSF